MDARFFCTNQTDSTRRNWLVVKGVLNLGSRYSVVGPSFLLPPGIRRRAVTRSGCLSTPKPSTDSRIVSDLVAEGMSSSQSCLKGTSSQFLLCLPSLPFHTLPAWKTYPSTTLSFATPPFLGVVNSIAGRTGNITR